MKMNGSFSNCNEKQPCKVIFVMKITCSMELYSFALLKSSIIKIFHIPNNSSTEVRNVPILQERVF